MLCWSVFFAFLESSPQGGSERYYLSWAQINIWRVISKYQPFPTISRQNFSSFTYFWRLVGMSDVTNARHVSSTRRQCLNSKPTSSDMTIPSTLWRNIFKLFNHQFNKQSNTRVGIFFDVILFEGFVGTNKFLSLTILILSHAIHQFVVNLKSLPSVFKCLAICFADMVKLALSNFAWISNHFHWRHFFCSISDEKSAAKFRQTAMTVYFPN